MTHKQWFNNVLHLHPVHEEGAYTDYNHHHLFALLKENSQMTTQCNGEETSRNHQAYNMKHCMVNTLTDRLTD